MNKKELIINEKSYEFNAVNKRAKYYKFLETLDVPIELDDIYNKYEFGAVENIGIVRELIKEKIINCNKELLDSVDVYKATLINTALLPYVLSCDVDIVKEFRNTFKLLDCHEILKKNISFEVDLLQLSNEKVIEMTSLSAERNILMRGYGMLQLGVYDEAMIRMIVKTQAEFYKNTLI